jgi:phosphoribosylanthranilate isomerase
MAHLVVQIYEIQTPREAEAMIALGVDHVGSVILSAAAWRIPGLRETVAAVRRAGATSSLIPLFQDLETIRRTLDYYRPDILHFCEAIPPQRGLAECLDRLLELQHRVKESHPQTRLMRTVPIAPPGEADRIPTFEIARRLAPASDWLLIDTQRAPADGAAEAQPVPGFIGITGAACDWSAARRLAAEASVPVILAGGISPENAGRAIAAVRPAGVDSCTLTNAADEGGRPVRFRKDPEKVARLVAAVRRAEKETEGVD